MPYAMTQNPQVTIEANQDFIDVSSSGHHIADPDWVYFDTHGHEHRFATDGTTNLPTLVWVVTGSYWCSECSDDHETGEWRCKQCADVVEPNYRWSGEQTIQVPGLLDARLILKYATGIELTYLLTRDELGELSQLRDEAMATRAVALADTKEPIFQSLNHH